MPSVTSEELDSTARYEITSLRWQVADLGRRVDELDSERDRRLARSTRRANWLTVAIPTIVVVALAIEVAVLLTYHAVKPS
jgi:type IV secretory pathway component VirB8